MASIRNIERKQDYDASHQGQIYSTEINTVVDNLKEILNEATNDYAAFGSKELVYAINELRLQNVFKATGDNDLILENKYGKTNASYIETTNCSFKFQVEQTNTSAVTIQILGSSNKKPLKRNGAELENGFLKPGFVYHIEHDLENDCFNILNIMADTALNMTGASINTYSVPNTIAVRDSNADITVNTVRLTNTETNDNIGYILTQVEQGDNSTDNYVRMSTPAQLAESLPAESLLSALSSGDGSGSGLDADKVDGVHAYQLLRSDIDTRLSGKIFQNSSISNSGLYGPGFNSDKLTNVWGVSRYNALNDDGTDYNNFYGLLYKYNDDVDNKLYAKGHQLLWCTYGVPSVGIGDTIWTKTNVTIGRDAIARGNLVENSLAFQTGTTGIATDSTSMRLYVNDAKVISYTTDYVFIPDQTLIIQNLNTNNEVRVSDSAVSLTDTVQWLHIEQKSTSAGFQFRPLLNDITGSILEYVHYDSVLQRSAWLIDDNPIETYSYINTFNVNDSDSILYNKSLVLTADDVTLTDNHSYIGNYSALTDNIVLDTTTYTFDLTKDSSELFVNEPVDGVLRHKLSTTQINNTVKNVENSYTKTNILSNGDVVGKFYNTLSEIFDYATHATSETVLVGNRNRIVSKAVSSNLTFAYGNENIIEIEASDSGNDNGIEYAVVSSSRFISNNSNSNQRTVVVNEANVYNTADSVMSNSILYYGAVTGKLADYSWGIYIESVINNYLGGSLLIGIGTAGYGSSLNNDKAIILGDAGTGIRQNGDGVLELFQNGNIVLKASDIIETPTSKEWKIGDLATQNYLRLYSNELEFMSSDTSVKMDMTDDNSKFTITPTNGKTIEWYKNDYTRGADIWKYNGHEIDTITYDVQLTTPLTLRGFNIKSLTLSGDQTLGGDVDTAHFGLSSVFINNTDLNDKTYIVSGFSNTTAVGTDATAAIGINNKFILGTQNLTNAVGINNFMQSYPGTVIDKLLGIDIDINLDATHIDGVSSEIGSSVRIKKSPTSDSTYEMIGSYNALTYYNSDTDVDNGATNAYGVRSIIDVQSTTATFNSVYGYNAELNFNNVDNVDASYLFYGKYNSTVNENVYGIYIDSDVESYLKGQLYIGDRDDKFSILKHNELGLYTLNGNNTDVILNLYDTGEKFTIQPHVNDTLMSYIEWVYNDGKDYWAINGNPIDTRYYDITNDGIDDSIIFNRKTFRLDNAASLTDTRTYRHLYFDTRFAGNTERNDNDLIFESFVNYSEFGDDFTHGKGLYNIAYHNTGAPDSITGLYNYLITQETSEPYEVYGTINRLSVKNTNTIDSVNAFSKEIGVKTYITKSPTAGRSGEATAGHFEYWVTDDIDVDNDNGTYIATGLYGFVHIDSHAATLNTAYGVKSRIDFSYADQCEKSYLFYGSYDDELSGSTYGVYIHSDVPNYFAGSIESGVGLEQDVIYGPGFRLRRKTNQAGLQLVSDSCVQTHAGEPDRADYLWEWLRDRNGYDSVASMNTEWNIVSADSYVLLTANMQNNTIPSSSLMVTTSTVEYGSAISSFTHRNSRVLVNATEANGSLSTVKYISMVENTTTYGRKALGGSVSLIEDSVANTAIGAFAGIPDSDDIGNYNTLIGYDAGGSWKGGEKCTVVGAYSGNTGLTGSYVTLLGYNAEPNSASESNVVVLGDSTIETLRCNVSSISSLSDKRDKKNIQEIPVGLDAIRFLKPSTFEWNRRDGSPGRKGTQIGFIAQDFKELIEKFPVLKDTSLFDDINPEKYTIAYAELMPIVTKAIQELDSHINEQDKRIDVLIETAEKQQNLIDALEKRLNELENNS